MSRQYHIITFTERKAIEMMYRSGMGADEIAAKLEVSISTIYRELKRGNTHQPDINGRSGYSAYRAQQYINHRRSYRDKRRRITSPIDDESDNKHTFSNRDI